METRETPETKKMKKIFSEFEFAENSNNIEELRRNNTIHAEAEVRNILDNPYISANVKIALNIAMKRIEQELKK